MTRLLLALALLAITARLLRKRHAEPVRSPEADDSEVVGMPTTFRDDELLGWFTWNPAPGKEHLPLPYIQLAPTSRN